MKRTFFLSVDSTEKDPKDAFLTHSRLFGMEGQKTEKSKKKRFFQKPNGILTRRRSYLLVSNTGNCVEAEKGLINFIN
jgi:hypothetical protein